MGRGRNRRSYIVRVRPTSHRPFLVQVSDRQKASLFRRPTDENSLFGLVLRTNKITKDVGRPFRDARTGES